MGAGQELEDNLASTSDWLHFELHALANGNVTHVIHGIVFDFLLMSIGLQLPTLFHIGRFLGNGFYETGSACVNSPTRTL